MGSVSVRNVSKDYVLGRTIVRALHDVSLEVERSEFLSIAGPSGSGKSTLLNLVSAIDSPTTGEVLIDGVNLKDLNDNDLSDLRANKIGFIFQTFNLIPVLSAYENVEFPLLFKRQGSVSR
ncbi:MAG: ATP-binding cassette domain-containing protein, partial [Vicinamibacteria bacterium]|nr:ATP-binding cassette domain-containing protein [Vicinamibacteria bacterium]